MINALLTTLPILLALIGGMLIGKYFSELFLSLVAKLIAVAVWVLLFSLGAEFGGALTDPAVAGRSLSVGLMFAACCTFGTWALVFVVIPSKGNRTRGNLMSVMRSLLISARGCVITLSIVAVGAAFSRSALISISDGVTLPSIAQLIWILVFLVGIEISETPVDRSWFFARAWALPITAIVGSWLGGLGAAVLSGESWITGLTIASGLGWMSLSSAMLGEALGDQYAAIVLISDLVRELIAITLLYLIGMRTPLACIAATGVTALDTTLPIIRLTCPEETVKLALISGLILTLVSPVLMALFISL